jgi:Mce-associated membrane protein
MVSNKVKTYIAEPDAAAIETAEESPVTADERQPDTAGQIEADPHASNGTSETSAAQPKPDGTKVDGIAADVTDLESETPAAQPKSDVTELSAAGPSPVNDDADESDSVDAQRKSTQPSNAGRRVSVSVRTLLVAILVVGLLAAAGVMTWLYLGEKAKLDDAVRQAAGSSHAERIALDYAVNAAKIDARDLNAWKQNLVKGTTPELKKQLADAGTSMEQILVPLQWNSTAVPLAAKVRSNANGIYVVDTFVGVQTKTVQAPDGLQSTATYSVTIDSKHDWQISDVGGIGSVVGEK